ncbi:type 1 glutamine amidotransferase domain-containing protein [Streptomyces sp. XD-27]|uniref:type 1 glutamine amidotransferase domain-containing protein n=1 Tax=Streptomyces sp. XD-27 TaxID=3062779 RepID=UPI0026F429DA|nr:type 1 glutamine amidotransferase domain-containing protein [Streptomyces sp. XD-27]WKX73252.1 type 1 glutamine amidotransferase domain-containing protein [Streptomyces sp. XD-27]
MKVAFLVAPKGVEQMELIRPWDAVRSHGGDPYLVSTKPGTVQAFRHLDPAEAYEVDRVVGETSARDYDALALPGGVANPDALRMDARAVRLVKEFFDAGKPVAAICHAPWMLVEADVVRGRTLTSWPSLRTDIRNAGGTWVDEQVVVCERGPNTLITSRKPADLPAFCETLVHVFSRAAQTAQSVL